MFRPLRLPSSAHAELEQTGSLFELCGAGNPALLIRLTYVDEKVSIDAVNAFGVHTKTRRFALDQVVIQGLSTHVVFGVMRYSFEVEELSARLKLPYRNTSIPLLGECVPGCGLAGKCLVSLCELCVSPCPLR